MYISGVPGTGKTATLRGVKQKLFDNSNSLPSFKFIEINGLKLAQPDRFCSHFLLVCIHCYERPKLSGRISLHWEKFSI